MKKTAQPNSTCNLTTDTALNTNQDPCKVVHKQYWPDCSQWSKIVTFESISEFREYRARNCSHGRGKNIQEELFNVKWYTFINNKFLEFDAARDFCQNQENGDLFGDIDGSTVQLMFLINKIGPTKSFWIGLVKRDGLFRNLFGVPKDDNIFWDTVQSQPSFYENELYLFVRCSTDQRCDGDRFPNVYHDTTNLYTAFFICDKMF